MTWVEQRLEENNFKLEYTLNNREIDQDSEEWKEAKVEFRSELEVK